MRRGVECLHCIHEHICEKTGYHVLHGCIYYENRKEGYWKPKQKITKEELDRLWKTSIQDTTEGV